MNDKTISMLLSLIALDRSVNLKYSWIDDKNILHNVKNKKGEYYYLRLSDLIKDDFLKEKYKKC